MEPATGVSLLVTGIRTSRCPDRGGVFGKRFPIWGWKGESTDNQGASRYWDLGMILEPCGI